MINRLPAKREATPTAILKAVQEIKTCNCLIAEGGFFAAHPDYQRSGFLRNESRPVYVSIR